MTVPTADASAAPASPGLAAALAAAGPRADVRAWFVPADEATCLRLEPLLADAERARATRLRTHEERARFVVGRATLRLALAAELGVPPHAVALRVGAHGRPALVRGGTLDFNVSHAAGLVLCAVAQAGRVGVDVESTRLLRSRDALAALACDPREQAWLRGLPVHLRREAFFELWTAKEACLKADGRGLTEDPAAVAIALDPRRPTLPGTLGAVFDSVRYEVCRLDCPPGYRAALATAVDADGSSGSSAPAGS